MAAFCRSRLVVFSFLKKSAFSAPATTSKKTTSVSFVGFYSKISPFSIQNIRFSTNSTGSETTNEVPQNQEPTQELSHPDYQDLNLQTLLRREEFIAVRRKLETDPREQMGLDEYLTICDTFGVPKQDGIRLSQSLTDAGVIFFNPLAKDPLLSQTIFLKPQKISNLIHAAFSEQKLFTGAGTVEEYNKLKTEFESMTVTKKKIDKRAHNYANFWVLATGGYMILQAGVLARFTWWEFSWDIMEPITYFITFSTGIVGWMYFAITKDEYTYENLRDGIARRRRQKLYKRLSFDIKRYEELEHLFIKPK